MKLWPIRNQLSEGGDCSFVVIFKHVLQQAFVVFFLGFWVAKIAVNQPELFINKDERGFNGGLS